MKQQTLNELLKQIKEECRLTKGYTGIDRFSPAVLNAIANVPRDRFVPHHMRHLSYENTPLPIGQGQTISQPFIVALMTELLQPSPSDTVLEIGAGSGYQAAVLSQLVNRLYTVEIVPELAKNAAKLLNTLGMKNVEVRQGDGSMGWPEHAPYDSIIVTAAAAEIPPVLTEQLKPGGRMVIPVGYPGQTQQLLLVEKDQSGNLTGRTVLPVAFVPFVMDGASRKKAA